MALSAERKGDADLDGFASRPAVEKKNLVSITSRADPGRAFTVMRS
jgi:hypothetical protein